MAVSLGGLNIGSFNDWVEMQRVAEERGAEQGRLAVRKALEQLKNRAYDTPSQGVA